MLNLRLHDEDGVALVTAILVSAIVLTLSVSAVAISIHNTDASGYDKRRLIAIGAAEAGIDYYYDLLSRTSLKSLNAQGSDCEETVTFGSVPVSEATIVPRFYPSSDTSGAGTPCPPAPVAPVTWSNYVFYVKVTSTGSIPGSAAPVRAMESKARLTAIGTSITFPSAAIYGSSAVEMSANTQLYGNGANNADVYSNGNISVSTASNLKGNMYVQGTATIANGNFQLAGMLWASSWIKVSGGKIGGGLTSSGSTTTTCPPGSNPASASICVSGNTLVTGGAKTGGTISIKAPPASVTGTLAPGTSGIGAPPSIAYPTYTFTATDWPGYVTDTSCANAVTRINNWNSGDLYIRLTGCATFNPPSKVLPGNLAILTDGAVTFTTGTKWTTNSATPVNAYLFTGMTGSCGDFLAQANSSIGTNIKVLIFTPQACTATIQSNSWNSAGQIFAGTVRISANTNLAFAPVDLPGATAGASGSLVDVVYRREVVPS